MESITARDAKTEDIQALTLIKGKGNQALHRDRLADAQGGDILRYLVLLMDGQVIGFSLLVMRRPAHWPDADDQEHLPQIVDLQVKEALRGRGFGTQFIALIEMIAAEAGFQRLYLSVEPWDNPRAYALYQRLGYLPLQPEPYESKWQFTDSSGKLHRGEDWIVDMVKDLVK